MTSLGRIGLLNMVLVTVAVLAGRSAGQEPVPGAAYATQPGEEGFTRLAADQLDTLLGPIALYPDPLIAQVLPASTYPIDIVKAARLVRSGAPADQIDQQNWDPSVKAVAHYPSVIEMMDQSIDWTQQLGQAFIAEPDEVMQSIQRLRAQAQNVGNLASTQQQQVLVESDAIRIVPADPEIIYVPVYQPAVAYYQAPVYGSCIDFGVGFPCGTWFDLDVDWVNHWCYRPGWTWNHWHEAFAVDRDRFIRARHEFEPRRGERPATVWHRDNDRPLTFPGRRLTRPSEFDQFRGRSPEQRRPTAAPVQHPTGVDRGRTPETPHPTGVMDPNRSGDNTRRALDRGRVSRQSEAPVPIAAHPPAPAPRPAPIRAPVAAPPHEVIAAPEPRHEVRPTPVAPAAPAAPRIATPPPARVAPPPVRIAPPPAAATRPSPPAYVRPTQGDDNNKNQGRGHR